MKTKKTMRFILAILGLLAASLFIGTALALAGDFNIAISVGIMFVGSLVLSVVVARMSAGVLPMAFTLTSAYAGEVLEQILVQLTTRNKFVDGGHIRVQPGVLKKFSIPRMRAKNLLQARDPEPEKNNKNKGDVIIDERYLTPQDAMVYFKFNPAAFETSWRPFQPTGPLVMEELPAEVQAKLTEQIIAVVATEIGEQMLVGEGGDPANGKFFDGILTRIKADAETVRVPDAVTIAEGNVISALSKGQALVPDAVIDNLNLKIFLSRQDLLLYQNVLKKMSDDELAEAKAGATSFRGIPMVWLPGMPKDTFFFAVGSPGIDSNLWASAAFVNDDEAVKIDRVSPDSELFFVKMLMKVDTNTVFGEDIVLYDGVAEVIPEG